MLIHSPRSARVEVEAAEGTCEARLEPVDGRAGLLRFNATNAGPEPIVVFAFALGAVSWSEVEAYVAAPPAGFASAPPVQEIRSIEIPAGGTGSWTADAPAGGLGVACVAGSFERPEIVLAGPLTLAP